MRRHVVFSSYWPPRFDRDSGSRRLHHLMEVLRDEGWHITFVALDAGEATYRRALQATGIEVICAATTSVEDFFRTLQPDLALLAYWPVAEHLLPIVRQVSPGTRIVVDSLDLHFVRDARARCSGWSGAGGALFDATYGDDLIGELNVYAAADAVLTVARWEADTLAALLGPTVATHVVPDGERAASDPAGPEERQGILFVGSFRHTPNVDAAGWLLGEVLPRVDEGLLARHPVYIVGEEPPKDLVHRARDGVHVLGWVPDLAPYYARCRVAVAPLRYGAGTKRKTVEAMLAGVPVVATSVGSEGIAEESCDPLLFADDAGDFAAALERLLSDDAAWGDARSRGMETALRRHGLDVVRESLLQAITTVLTAAPRRNSIVADQGRIDRRVRSQHVATLVPRLQQLVRGCPPESRVLVASAGHGRLLHLGCAITEDLVEVTPRTLRDRDGDYLLLPELSWEPSLSAPELSAYLAVNARLVERTPGVGALYVLARAEGHSVPEARAAAVSARESVAHRNPVARAEVVAFYLPQFHPIPENDAWWGPGFTEWTNVTRASPLFSDHHQPHLPADLGLYDLRVPEVRSTQAQLAREYGVSAFCYYHYWFKGKQLLERPFHEVLTSGEPDFPFLLCWANEPWSRRWDGRPNDVLQAQGYSPEDDVEHIRALLPALRDPRAFQVHGRPAFVIYQAKDLPDPAATVERWRREVRRAGLPGLYLMSVETSWDEGWDATEAGFDAKILFQPQFTQVFRTPRLEVGPPDLRVHDYKEFVTAVNRPPRRSYPVYETVCPGWDNSARTGSKGVVLHGSSADVYESWLADAVARAQDGPADRPIVFVNAWNEWGEGAHLEPDEVSGLTYLEATRRVVRSPGVSRR